MHALNAVVYIKYQLIFLQFRASKLCNPNNPGIVLEKETGIFLSIHLIKERKGRIVSFMEVTV